MSSYFDVLSWTRARKNREALEKTNPQNPVLNDDDEQFLQKITSQEEPAPPLPTIEPTVIDDDGNEKEADATQKEAAEMILPSSPGESKEKRTWASYIPSVGVPSVPAMPSLASLRGNKAEKPADEKQKVESGDSDVKTEGASGQEETSVGGASEKEVTSVAQPAEVSSSNGKNDSAEKTQTYAEAARDTAQEPKDESTRDPESLETAADQESTKDQAAKPVSESKEDTETQDAVKDEADIKEPIKEEAETKAATQGPENENTDEPAQRTWASYIPAMPAIPSIGKNAKGKDAAEVAAKAQSPESKEQDEREVSVLLDRLNLSAINNRVFSFSDQSQKIYGEFTTILKDIVNGAPTAWEDLETLLKTNEKHLEGMFKNMPPFVQTLVKSLPAKFASSMGPEIMAVSGDKPGNDMKKRMEAASHASSSASAGAQNLNLDVKKKQKKKVPGLKDLASQKGTVTSMLTNIVNFLKVRFPAFVTGTNVVMSLAVFILLFVFWYCHKRGKEVRMLRESESAKASASVSEVSESESDQDEKEAKDSGDALESDTEEEKIAAAKAYAAGTQQKSSVGGPDNAAALRAKKILEQE